MTNTNKEKQSPYNVLVEEVKERIRKLKEFGMSEKEINSLFHTLYRWTTWRTQENYPSS